MGHSVYILSYHDVDTASVERTGEELSRRFGVNVECYYRDNYDPDLFVKNDYPTYDDHLLATYTVPDATVTWQLYDENYVQRQYWQQQGENIKAHPFFQNSQNHLDELLLDVRTVRYELYDKTDDDTKWLADIHEALWICEFHYFGCWWSLCRCFMQENWPQKLVNLNEFRKELKNTLRKMGAEAALYVDDQGESVGYVDRACEATSWPDFVMELQEQFGGKCLHVSDFLKAAIPLSNDDDPLAFYDDFQDFAVVI